MKFSLIDKGTRATKRVTLTLQNGAPVEILIRPLTGLEELDARAWAFERARAKGVAEPAEGHPIVDVAFHAAVVAAACLDPESGDAREAFFAGPDEVLAGLDTDTIALLYERQAIWQEECSPVKGARTLADLVEMTRKLAESRDDSFFVHTSFSTRVTWARFMAVQALKSPELKSLSISPTPGSGTTSSSGPRRRRSSN